MLVLTRRVGEEIVIEGDIRITVVAVKGARVRVGVTAPEFVRVDRREIHERRGEFGGEFSRPSPASATNTCGSARSHRGSRDDDGQRGADVPDRHSGPGVLARG